MTIIVKRKAKAEEAKDKAWAKTAKAKGKARAKAATAKTAKAKGKARATRKASNQQKQKARRAAKAQCFEDAILGGVDLTAEDSADEGHASASCSARAF